MKRRQVQPDDDRDPEASLFRALLSLESVEELRAFLQDLCTPAEVRTRVAWSGVATPADDAATAWTAYEAVAAGLVASATWHERLRRQLDVRPLVPANGRLRRRGPSPAPVA